jgi:hypothetical protein
LLHSISFWDFLTANERDFNKIVPYLKKKGITSNKFLNIPVNSVGNNFLTSKKFRLNEKEENFVNYSKKMIISLKEIDEAIRKLCKNNKEELFCYEDLSKELKVNSEIFNNRILSISNASKSFRKRAMTGFIFKFFFF